MAGVIVGWKGEWSRTGSTKDDGVGSGMIRQSRDSIVEGKPMDGQAGGVAMVWWQSGNMDYVLNVVSMTTKKVSLSRERLTSSLM